MKLFPIAQRRLMALAEYARQRRLMALAKAAKLKAAQS